MAKVEVLAACSILVQITLELCLAVTCVRFAARAAQRVSVYSCCRDSTSLHCFTPETTHISQKQGCYQLAAACVKDHLQPLLILTFQIFVH